MDRDLRGHRQWARDGAHQLSAFGTEIRYIVEDSDAKVLIVQHDIVGAMENICSDLSIAESRHVHFGGTAAPKGYLASEGLIAAASVRAPEVAVALEDTWALIYSPGTSARPAFRGRHELATEWPVRFV